MLVSGLEQKSNLSGKKLDAAKKERDEDEEEGVRYRTLEDGIRRGAHVRQRIVYEIVLLAICKKGMNLG